MPLNIFHLNWRPLFHDIYYWIHNDSDADNYINDDVVIMYKYTGEVVFTIWEEVSDKPLRQGGWVIINGCGTTITR